ncbi:Leucinostatins biosynthesis cluster protein T [Cladobotryum mycophilum]|uniref:Leucinostatins biosynthesis cluster protein T n=1 Tax=Cladobotryum mycophilum TaxID=491253 RepID=A0ABR0SY60_9HYPO
MKVIVTGATGTAGQAVIKQCLEDDQITKVIVLTRKAVPIDIESHPKAQVVMHQDFSQYPEEMMRRFEGAEACLWAIGGKVNQFNHDKQICRKVSVDYTLAAANAMLQYLADKTPEGRKFRFVFCSGKYAEWNPKRPLLFMADTRRIKGEVEKGLCDLADANKDKLDVWILRPSGFISPDAPFSKRLVGNLYGAITTTQVGKTMVKVGHEGWKDRIIENEVLLKM